MSLACHCLPCTYFIFLTALISTQKCLTYLLASMFIFYVAPIPNRKLPKSWDFVLLMAASSEPRTMPSTEKTLHRCSSLRSPLSSPEGELPWGLLLGFPGSVILPLDAPTPGYLHHLHPGYLHASHLHHLWEGGGWASCLKPHARHRLQKYLLNGWVMAESRGEVGRGGKWSLSVPVASSQKPKHPCGPQGGRSQLAPYVQVPGGPFGEVRTHGTHVLPSDCPN